MSKFQKGDLVELKSGGPVMTVEEVGSFEYAAGITDGVKCVYFDGNKRVSEIFDAATLQSSS